MITFGKFYAENKKIFAISATTLIASLSAQSFAATCWKAVSWDADPTFSWALEANVVAQDCTVTPDGFEWLEPGEIHEFETLPADTYLAIEPSVLSPYSSPAIVYLGVMENGLADFKLTVIGGEDNPVNTTTTPPVTPSFYWTAWLDRDNASGSGDWEHRGGFNASQVCEYPIDIEAKITDSKVYTPQDQTPDMLRFFDGQKGLACLNNEQTDRRCSDYKVRFACQPGTWTSWINRDAPGGTGDYEIASMFTSPQVCDNPTAIRARVIGTTKVISDISEAPDQLSSFGPRGLTCKNALQDDEYCSNYEVRFLCP